MNICDVVYKKERNGFIHRWILTIFGNAIDLNCKNIGISEVVLRRNGLTPQEVEKAIKENISEEYRFSVANGSPYGISYTRRVGVEWLSCVMFDKTLKRKKNNFFRQVEKLEKVINYKREKRFINLSVMENGEIKDGHYKNGWNFTIPVRTRDYILKKHILDFFVDGGLKIEDFPCQTRKLRKFFLEKKK